MVTMERASGERRGSKRRGGKSNRVSEGASEKKED
jgi:hypothetical protein